MKVLFRNLHLGLSPVSLACGIGLSPEHFSEGGTGFMDDVDVQFLALKFIVSDGTPYDKAGKKTVPLLSVAMLPDGTDEVRTQYFSCGQLDDWTPSTDGETLVPVSAKAKESQSINKTCNAAMFIDSLFKAGVPAAKLDSERISDLAGIKAHVVVTKRPKDNIKRAEGEKEPTVLTVSRLISTPWGGNAAAVTSPAQATAAAVRTGQGVSPIPAPAAPNGNGVAVFDDAALAMLAMSVLAASGGSLSKMQLMQEVYKAAAKGDVDANSKDPSGQPARTTIPKRISADAFLSSQPYWRYDGATVTLIG